MLANMVTEKIVKGTTRSLGLRVKCFVKISLMVLNFLILVVGLHEIRMKKIPGALLPLL